MADRTPLARVSALQGKAFARDQDGNLRQLQIGDVIYEGDVVVTGAGSRIDLATPDRHSLVLRANETLTVDAEVFATVKPDATDAALVGGARDINRVIKAINEGGSLDALLDETAAGAGTPGGADGGPTFVRLLRIVETLDPLAFDFGTDRRGSVDEPLDGVGSAADALAGLVDAGLAGQSAAAAAATVGGSIPIDTAAPSVVVDIVDASLNNGDKVSTVTFTFSDAPSGFDLTDVTAVGGTLSGLAVSLTDPKVYTALFTANDGFTGIGSVSVADASYTNAAGNIGTGHNDTVVIDTAPPLPTITLDADITADDILNASEATASITVTGKVGGDAKAGDTVTLTVNGQTFTGNVVDTAGVLTFAIAVPGADLLADGDKTIAASITTTDAAGNSGSASDSEGYTVDTAAPSVVVDIVDTSLNSGDKVSTVT
ncbi:retention module-containing protein, partial [Accumulibacter sp.]|uniref:retention module-containing protein n=1 Tax=Accumulibacter sp. TaxID=2053492 RepID=UPI001A5156C1